MKEYDLIVLLGPTASGKTDLSIKIAKQINGEIINADAFQVYKKMNIGTGKATDKELNLVPHHLIDIIDYQQEFDVNQFQKLARSKINELLRQNITPIIVGGSNLYVDSIIYDYQFNNNDLFNDYKKLMQNMDIKLLQDYIIKHNIELNNSEFNNHKRLVNHVLKHYLNLDVNNNKKQLVYKPLFIKIDIDRDELYNNINNRVDKMFNQGLIDEVQQFNKDYNSQQAIGYKEVHQYLNQEIDLNTCINLVKQKSRNYAKRQINWINKYDTDIIVKREGNKWIKKN